MNSITNKPPLIVVKVGGNILDNPTALTNFLRQFAQIEGNKILVHGGGKLATTLAEKLDVPQRLVEGRRITSRETLEIVTMVYAGKINKTVVAELQNMGCNAVGITGADGNTVLAHKRVHSSIDYGFVGDVERVNTQLLSTLLAPGFTVVVAPLTHDAHGTLLNTNADTIAQELAQAFVDSYDVTLLYSFEKAGVLLDVNNELSIIRKLNAEHYQQLKQQTKVYEGMIPKLDNAFEALHKGVAKVVIGNATKISELILGTEGTTIELE